MEIIKHLVLSICSVLLIFVSPVVFAGSDSKTEMKKIKSWNLKEWLDQKERNKMMDMWLVMHTPSPYEFALSYLHVGATQSLDLIEKEIEFPQASFMAYASFVGLEIQSEDNSEGGYQDTVGIFHFRLLGVADQSTHLTLNFGQKSRKFKNIIGESLRKQRFGEVDLTIYFNDYFGIQGLYRNYLPIENDPNWGSITGTQNELGGFIDYEFLRIFINYIKEVELRTLNSTKSDYSLMGYKSGIKLYF